jgi:hypothetical protein
LDCNLRRFELNEICDLRVFELSEVNMCTLNRVKVGAVTAVVFFVFRGWVANGHAQNVSTQDLCRSEDVTSQRFCLQRLKQKEELTKTQRRSLEVLASKDSPEGRDARNLLERASQSQPAKHSETKGDPTRVFATPTAFTNREGKTTMQATQLGAYDFYHGVTDNLQVSGGTNIPIGILSLGGALRYSVETSFGAVGATGFGRYFIPSGGRENTAFITGAGPLMTIGDRDSALTIGAEYMHMRGLIEDFYEDDARSTNFVLAHVGAYHRVRDSVRLQIEAMQPVSLESDPELFTILIWGAQVGSESFWGDIGIVSPICDDCGDIYEATWFGIPYLGFGASF